MTNSTSSSPSKSIPPTTEYDIDPGTGAVLIPLSSKKYPGLVALVDSQDAGHVTSQRWSPAVRKNGTLVYAESGKRVLMHRFILGISDPKVHVDHVNHDGLDNRRSNLRIVVGSQNHMNQRPQVGRTSMYKGVYWDKGREKWRSRINANGQRTHLGYFDDEREAAEVYDGAALMLFGSYACLNFPDDDRQVG